MFVPSRILPRAKTPGALLLAELVAAPAMAQLRTPEVGVGASAALPTGGLYSGYKTGWQGMAFVALRIRGWPVGFRLDDGYSVNTSNQPINGEAWNHKIELRGWDVDVTITFRSPSRVKPYLLLGSGLYRVDETLTPLTIGANPGVTYSRRNEFTYNLGAGFTLGPVFCELRYVHVDGFGKDFSYILVPVTAGLRIGGW